MTIPQAIAELEDRGVPEVIKLLRDLAMDIRKREEKMVEMQQELDKLKYGEF